MDLLARWDWDATADKMAANDPSLYPDAMMYQEFAVDEPEESSADTESTTDEVSSELASAAEPGAAEPPEATSPEAVADKDMPATEPAPEETTDTVPEGEEAEQTEVERPATLQKDSVETPATVPVDAGESAGSFTSGIMWRLALGLALGAAAVVVAGFVLIRKQG